MDRLFWKNKRVFLTGHTGFKGSWLSLWLQHLGAEITGFSLPAPTEPNLFETANVSEHMTSVIGDIRDLKSIEEAIHKAEPEIVIHMAAQSLVRHSYAHPIDTYSTNIMGLVHLLEAVRTTPSIKAVLNITSDKCYENIEHDVTYKEYDAMGGYDPYSSSKGCSEIISSAYRRSFNVPIATARAGNVIGGGDWAKDRLIPDILKAFGRNENVFIRSPNSIRPWQHVLEPLSGYLDLVQALCEKGSPYTGGWNFGAHENDAKPVEWIVEHMTQKWGKGAAFTIDPKGANLHEAQYLKLDCSKAQRKLGWQPKWDLLCALDKVVEWHQAYIAQDDMYTMTLQQISEFMED